MVAFTITDHNFSDVDASSYTPTVSIGSGGAERTIAISAGGRAVGEGITNTGISVAAVAADEVVKHTFNTGGFRCHMAGMYLISAADLPNPNATSVALDIGFSAIIARCGWKVAVTSDPIDPAAFHTNKGDLSAVGTVNVPINTPDDGAVLGFAFGSSGAVPDISWTNLTKAYEDPSAEGAGTWSAATAADTSAETGRAVSASGTFPVVIVASFAPAADTTAPTLSNPTAAATGETTADLAVDTDEGNGTLFWVVTTSASPPSGAQVAAGQDHTGAAASDSGSQSVSGTGTQNANATGLSAGTNYWAYFVQDDAATNRSNVVSDNFTTDSPPPPSGGNRWQQRGGVALNEEQRKYWKRMREEAGQPALDSPPQREAPPPPKIARKAKSKPSVEAPQREAVDGRVLESVKKTVSKLEQRKRREQEDDDESVLMLIA